MRHGIRAIGSRVLCSLLLCGLGLAAQAASPAREQLDRFLSEVNSFHARFEQQLFDEYGEPLETASGEVDILRPGRFNWSYEAPYRQRIVSDGKTLWVYDEDLAQVTINDVELGSVDSPGRLLGDEVDVDASFDVTDLPATDGVQWLRLKPKASGQQFNDIELGLRDGKVVAMRLKDNLGQTTAISFSELVHNPAIDPKNFQFKAPPDVDIIRGTGS